jgi:SRSO17 transposase
MDAQQIRRLRPKLNRFLSRFDDCFPRRDTRTHLLTYVQGQLSELPDKSVEPIAVKAGVAPRTLQEFLSQHRWDNDGMRDGVQEIVRTEHSGAHSIGILDETSFVKKGDKTPGVQRQWCGTSGKKDNCTVTVHLAYACDHFHALIDSELFLPESWSEDRERCREAGIPDEMTYRPKWRIGLELYDHAVGNGLSFDWFTFDEGYGSKPDFLRGLATRGQRFVGEVPRSFTGWLKAPRVVTRAYHRRRRGPGRKIPRLASGSRPAVRVEELLNRPEMRDQPWQRWRVKDGDKGPMIGEVKHARFHPKDDSGLPGEPLHLLVARNVLNPEEIKFFVSNAAPQTSVGPMLLAAFSRWRVERCFEDHKGEVGMDHYEGRRYLGLKRHLILSAVSYLFLARVRQECGGEKPGADGVPGAYGDRGVDPRLVAGATSLGEAGGTDGGGDPQNAAENQGGAQEPHQADPQEAARVRHQAHRLETVQVGQNLALSY